MSAIIRRPEELEAYYTTSQLPGARGATAGIPGTWTPAGAIPPGSPADLIAGRPFAVTASPATAWTTGQFVQTRTAGASGRAFWNGTAWATGAAVLETGDSSGPSPARKARQTAQEAP